MQLSIVIQITYRILSRALDVHVNTAKEYELLFSTRTHRATLNLI